MARGEDTSKHDNRRVDSDRWNPSIVMVPSNWSDMSESQKEDFHNYGKTIQERGEELKRRNGRW